MTRLEERMRRLSEASAEQLPDDALEVVERTTAELVDSGLVDRSPGVGERAPDFALPDTEGETVRLGDRTDRGPVILSFYRGRW
ncbi:MAG: redoxin domain-containing protein [Gemmatimonadota bacterium]